MTPRVKFVTLGCKVNQYETQAMREAVARAGARETSDDGRAAAIDDGCDFVIINTCTVTEKADRESRYSIRRARRDHPSAKIVVTGCYAERNRQEIEALPEVDLVLSNHEKADIAERLFAGCATPQLQDVVFTPQGCKDGGRGRDWKHRYAPLSISRTEGNGRAFLKIQDGCNHACSFCKVVLVRGRSRSRPLPEIVDEAKRLRDAGYREIVFAGIQLGAYGADFPPKDGSAIFSARGRVRRHSGGVAEKPAPTLMDVLAACSEVEGIERLRLSSIEPTDVTPELIEALRDIPKCCPHLHIPLQSGDDEILKAMNRRYGRSFYIDLVERLKSELTDFSLTLDVMAGFPGEEERHFENTIRLLQIVKPLKCHVFPYSRRGGTRAARLPNCEAKTVRERVNLLIGLEERLGHAERMKYQGRVMPVLVEKHDARAGMVQGLTPNYLKVCFEGNSDGIGKIVPVKLLNLQGDIFLAAQAS